MLQVLLSGSLPDAAGADPATAEHVRDALLAGGGVAEIILCLPGETDVVVAVQFAKAAIDWWGHAAVREISLAGAS